MVPQKWVDIRRMTNLLAMSPPATLSCDCAIHFGMDTTTKRKACVTGHVGQVQGGREPFDL